jgi:A/G-specific adenine glycosylase
MVGNGRAEEKGGPSMAEPVLAWYDANARILPWRAPPNAREAPDPYRVWIAEVMLQQTTVAAAIPRYRDFLLRFPTVEALAAAPEAELMEAWAGLGYYARARNLAASARRIAAGGFPRTAAALSGLPGVGAYTAAAVAAIAFGERVAVVDANIERVFARYAGVTISPPRLKAIVATQLQPHVPADRPGDFAQALMDLGATLCTPRAPQCLPCPLAEGCVARATGSTATLPAPKPRRDKPQRYGTAWWIERDGAVALVRRPPHGLLGGMLALPGTAWGSDQEMALPFPAAWQTARSPVWHGFTHFTLELSVAATRVSEEPRLDLPIIWTAADAISGLPTVFAKAVRAVQAIRKGWTC